MFVWINWLYGKVKKIAKKISNRVKSEYFYSHAGIHRCHAALWDKGERKPHRTEGEDLPLTTDADSHMCLHLYEWMHKKSPKMMSAMIVEESTRKTVFLVLLVLKRLYQVLRNPVIVFLILDHTIKIQALSNVYSPWCPVKRTLNMCIPWTRTVSSFLNSQTLRPRMGCTTTPSLSGIIKLDSWYQLSVWRLVYLPHIPTTRYVLPQYRFLTMHKSHLNTPWQSPVTSRSQAWRPTLVNWWQS